MPNTRELPITRTIPAAYFITFSTYGSWLHGDERGSVDPNHNEYLAPLICASPRLEARKALRLDHRGVVLGYAERQIVEAAIRGVCEFKGWRLHALNVRTNHVHIVVTSDNPPERVMNTLKSWATRLLREAELVGADQHVWTRHGSTRHLWDHDSVVHSSDTS